MTDIFPQLPRPLGIYTLTRLLELRENSALYVAQQNHVDRNVVLEVLIPGVSHDEEVAFLAQARLRVASSELPHVAHVFESLRAEGIWFLTQELPQGTSLAELAARGSTLSVPHICRVIAAAADMYTPCYHAELGAMPLAPSSIFIEADGDVHFLSPLVEGRSNDAAAQMSALAAALWPLVPQEREPGLGRAITLLQWLTHGYEGELLDWSALGNTAQTILGQLEQETAQENPQSAISDLLNNKRKLKKLRKTTAKWGLYLGGAAAIIIGMSCLGTLYGLAETRKIPAGNELSFLCRDGNSQEQIYRRPVSIAEYSAFIQAYDALSPEQKEQLLGDTPAEDTDPTPADWETQQENKSPDEAVTGVSFWQARLYARYHGGDIPTAAQIQAVQAAGVDSAPLEWSRTVESSPLPGIYTRNTPLLVTGESQPYPVTTRSWRSDSCGFRISKPETK